MGLLEKLKSALGLDGARSSEATPSGDVDVTVERKPSTEQEDAVKGTETATADADTGTESVAETDATTETDSGGASTDTEPVDEPEADATESEPTDDTDAVEGSSDPVTELDGIGPAYAERLHGLDIGTVGELAVADAADIAEQTDLGQKRVADWIDQAKAY